MSRLSRLLPVIACYGDAIEFDLLRLGLDLIDVFRGSLSWRRLEVILDHLPAGSAFWAARAGDVDAAEAFLDANPGWEPKGGVSTVPLYGLDLAAQQLLGVQDLLAVISAKLDAIGGDPSPKVDPTPRPRFALDAALARRERRELDSLVAEANAAIARSDAARDGG